MHDRSTYPSAWRVNFCNAMLFQGESHYDEEKEIIQKQLKIERDELLVICQQHQVCSALKTVLMKIFIYL